MGTRRKSKPEEPTFASRAAAEGTAISVVVDGEEQTIEAAHGADGWSITPKNAAQAEALAKYSDDALNPPPPPEAEPDSGDDDAGDAGDGGDQA